VPPDAADPHVQGVEPDALFFPHPQPLLGHGCRFGLDTAEGQFFLTACSRSCSSGSSQYPRQRWIATVTIGYDGRGKRITRRASGKTKTETKDSSRKSSGPIEIGPLSLMTNDQWPCCPRSHLVK
jgi:hypothetical protein